VKEQKKRRTSLVLEAAQNKKKKKILLARLGLHEVINNAGPACHAWGDIRNANNSPVLDESLGRLDPELQPNNGSSGGGKVGGR